MWDGTFSHRMGDGNKTRENKTIKSGLHGARSVEGNIFRAH